MNTLFPASVLSALLAVPQAAPSPPAKPQSPAAPSKQASPSPGKPGAGKDAQGYELNEKGFRISPKRGVFLLPWEGPVGQTANAKEIIEVTKEADKWGPGQTIVLDIKSPGGLVIEIFKIVDAIKAAREKHRVVVWVSEAISAAAVTSMQCDEIYFRSTGALGAAMMIQGRKSAYGEGLEQFREEIGATVERNGRPRMVFEAMVLAKAVLTYTKDPVTGKVTWHDRITGLPGEVVVSDEKDNLCFNAQPALDSKFSSGTADTKEELAKLLGLTDGWYEISDYGVKISEKLRKDYESCGKELQKLEGFASIGGSSPRESLQAQLKLVDAQLKWAQKCPTCIAAGMIQYNEIVEQLRKQKQQIQKQLADLNKAGG